MDADTFGNLSSSFDQVRLNYEELKKKNAGLERAAATHHAEVASLNGEVTRLRKLEVELMEEVAKLKDDLVAAKNHEEKELARLRNDRFAKVTRTTEKAQARLNKVKSYMKE